MSANDDNPTGIAMEPAALDRLWDAMNRQFGPVGGRTGAASIEAADTIRHLANRDDAPPATSIQIDAMWATIAAATLPATAVSASALTADSESTASRGLRFLAMAQAVVRQAAIGALAGFLVGMLVVGGGARIFMRVAALLSEPQLMGTSTVNGNEVGAITFGGTLALMFFSGALPGLMGGIVVMSVRPWLPSSGWRRLVLAGAIGFAVAGPIVLEGGENADYKRFGIFGLNVCLFTLLPFFFGVTVVPVIDRLDRRVPSTLPSLRTGAGRAGLSLLMLLLALPLIPLALSAFALGPAGLLLLLPPLVWVAAPLWARHAPSIDERRRRELRGLQLGYAALAVPCLLGIVLMAQSIAQLMN